MRYATMAVLVLAALVLVPALASPAVAQSEINVSGKVVDADGAPLSGITITAVNASDARQVTTTTSRDDGTFAFNVLPGEYDITATSAAYRADSSYTKLELRTARDDISFTMTEILGTMNGHVTNGTSPIAGARVSMLGPDESMYNTTTDKMGDFRIEKMRPGTYVVSIIAFMDSNQPLMYWDSIDVAEGENWLNRTVTGQSTLSGVVRSGQEPMADVRVTLSSETGYSLTTSTTAEGRFLISNVPAGHYIVTFSKNGYRTSESTVDLAPLGYKTLDMEMNRTGLPISEGFLAGYDLAHSLMIVGLGLALGTLVMALVVRYRVRKKPEMLSEDESEK